ncbi:sugar ABC transporter permease [Microaerobacter geothermalis]|uniref:carbohydrate ABC transporter permease n=1 Tax=Microaerobacter geothermalis TaxID=674972 RepID=UPI001F20237B|nr:sugar ABC transporter permease [Microaerobacter geothermalis]MCF6092789.1 sugar ABC transporter permease [Microaerobacter geothermalis]
MTSLKRYRLELAMALPLAVYIFGFTLIPIFQTIYLSLKNPDTGSFPSFINYQYIFGRPEFLQALINTVLITLIGLTLQLLIAFIIALILKRSFFGRGFFRTILLIPMGVPTLVSGVTLLYIFATSGYLNEFLFRLGWIDIPIDWASGGIRTIMMVVFADMWKVLPLVILILLAGLESIPEEIYEASSIDGASSWQNLWNVTLPLLKPSITMALILRAIDSFRIFELPLVLAGQNTPVLATYAYVEYNRYNNLNTSGAAATILLFIIILFITLYLFLVEKKEKGV